MTASAAEPLPSEIATALNCIASQTAWSVPSRNIWAFTRVLTRILHQELEEFGHQVALATDVDMRVFGGSEAVGKGYFVVPARLGRSECPRIQIDRQSKKRHIIRDSRRLFSYPVPGGNRLLDSGETTMAGLIPRCCMTFALIFLLGSPLWSQESDPAPKPEPAQESESTDDPKPADEPADEPKDEPADESKSTEEPAATEGTESTDATAETDEAQSTSAVDSARDALNAAAEVVEKSKQVNDVSAGILQPIYLLAERFGFPQFHWLAFAVMVCGVVSFALQLTLGKLVVLAKLGFSFGAVMLDVLGLSVSLVGLVLTTQAAAENSSFTQSAVGVVSATACGILVGLLFYVWGQRQELQALAGRKAKAAAADAE